MQEVREDMPEVQDMPAEEEVQDDMPEVQGMSEHIWRPAWPRSLCTWSPSSLLLKLVEVED